MKAIFKAVSEKNNGWIHTRSIANAMRLSGEHRSTTQGNLGKAYYQIRKAFAAGYLVKAHSSGLWRLSDLGAAWCGAANVTNTP